MPANQDGLRFLFDIQDKITAKLAKIEAKSAASAKKIDSAFTKASKAQEATAAKVIHTEKLRSIAVENATAKATAARAKETAQGKILAQRLASAQSNEARKAENFRIAAAKRTATALAKAERANIGTLGKIGKASRKLGVVGQLAFGAFGVAAAQMGEQVEQGLQAVQAGTGATGEKLDDLQESFVRVSGQVPQAAGIIGSALADLNTLTGATGNVLEDLTIRTADASRLWGGDAATNAKLLGGAMKQWQVPAERGADLIDTLGSVSQQYGVSLDKLLTTTKDYSAVLINAGFSMDESLDLFGRLEGAGISVSRVMPGLNAAFRKWADAGKDSRVELSKVVDQIGTTEDAQLALSIATEAFGAEGAQRMVTAIRTGQIPSLDDLGSALANATGTLDTAAEGSQTFGQNLLELKNSIAAAVPPEALQAFGSAALLFSTMGPLLAAINLKTIALSVSQGGATAAQWLLNAAMTANPIGLAVAAVAALAAGIYLLWKRYNKLQETFDAAAASTDDLTARYDDLTEKVAATEEQLELVRKGAVRDHPIYAKRLRALVAERDELEQHIKQRGDAAKAAEKLAKVEAAATEVQKKAAKAASESDEAVQGLIDSWTGATLKSAEFLRAFEKLTPAQRENDRIMGQVLTKYESMRKVLGPFDDELEKIRRATQRWTPALAALNKEQEKSATSVAEAAKGLPALNVEVRNLGMSQGVLDLEIQAVNKSLDKGVRAFAESRRQASGYELALASLAGQMGGAAGQALNLVLAMREHNKEQKLAASAGKKTEAQFSSMQTGAAKLGFAFSAIGEAVGGTAGAVLNELAGIASAFATGGVVGGIMAGIGSLIKGLKGLFGRGKRKREKAAAEERARLAAVAAAAEEAAERMRAAAEKAAAEIKAYWDSVYAAAIPAFERARDAGIAAYDEIYLAALESGLGQEEAIAKAEAAQLAASEAILKAEGEKFARMAAFEAALEAIRGGNAAGAADAAALAAAETRAAWETAMDAVTVADQAATDSMIDTANKVADIKKRRAEEAAAAQIAADRRAAEAARRQAEEYDSYGDDPYGMYGGHDPYGDYDGYRQHGGPVSAGRSYMVGEAGPERFIPSARGRIEPHGNGGGTVDPRVLARAIKDSLEGTAIEVDGRKLGRLTIRHQPLAVAELGGRR